MGAGAIAAMMARREREIVEDFRAAGATSSEAAQSYTATGFGASQVIKRLHRHAVIREGAPGTYYLDEEAWAAVREARKRIAMVIIAILVVLLLGVLLGTMK